MGQVENGKAGERQASDAHEYAPFLFRFKLLLCRRSTRDAREMPGGWFRRRLSPVACGKVK
jgi:hypothetical protein